MSRENYSISLQLAVNVMVEIEAESFEEALIVGRGLVKDHRSIEHMVKRSLMKTDRAVTVQDTEGHLIGVSNDDAGCMYR